MVLYVVKKSFIQYCIIRCKKVIYTEIRPSPYYIEPRWIYCLLFIKKLLKQMDVLFQSCVIKIGHLRAYTVKRVHSIVYTAWFQPAFNEEKMYSIDTCLFTIWKQNKTKTKFDLKNRKVISLGPGADPEGGEGPRDYAHSRTVGLLCYIICLKWANA